MLSQRQRDWLETEGEDTLGLTRIRVGILIAVLQHGTFSLREIARTTGQTPEGVRAAVDMLTARQLIDFYPVGPTRGRTAAYHAEPGPRLRLLLERLVDRTKPTLKTT